MNIKKKISLVITVVICSTTAIAQDALKSEQTVLVVGDKVNVRKSPSVNSNIVYQLRLAERVEIIKKSSIKYNKNNVVGEWVFIDTGYTKPGGSDSIKGWVVDYFLADYSKFKIIKYSLECHISGTIGDWHMDYQFIKNGKYRRKDSKNNFTTGNIYRYRDVLIFKDDNSDTFDFFYFDEKDRLCHYFRNREGKSICTKCKMK